MLWMLIFLLHCNPSFLSFPFPFYYYIAFNEKKKFSFKNALSRTSCVPGQDGLERSVVTEAPLCAFCSAQSPSCCSLFFSKCVSLLALVCWVPFAPFCFTEGTERQSKVERQWRCEFKCTRMDFSNGYGIRPPFPVLPTLLRCFYGRNLICP